MVKTCPSSAIPGNPDINNYRIKFMVVSSIFSLFQAFTLSKTRRGFLALWWFAERASTRYLIAAFEALHPRDEDGKFVEDGKRFCELGRSAQNSDKTMLYDFISESLENRKAPHKWIKIGDIDNEAQNRIMQKCGAKVSEIHIDNSGIIHAMSKPQHNLKHGDLLLAVDVINSTNNISLSEKKHKSNVVLIFKDVDDEITFLTEVHVKNGYLLVFDAWRQKKARRDPDAAKRPPEANVRNESPPADA